MPTANVTMTLPASLLRIAGLSDADLVEIRSLVARYNLTNAANIVGITALAYVARNPACCSNDVMLDWTGVPGLPPIAASASVPKLDGLPPDIGSLVSFVNGLGEEGQPTMVASLFRQLTQWPSSLAVTAVLLTPLAQSGELTRLRQETMRAAERIASELISSPRVGFPPPPQAGAGGHAARVGSVQDDLDRQDAAGWANLIAGSQTGLAVTFTARKFIVPISRSGQYEPRHCAKRRAKRCRTHANVKSSIRMLIPASEVRQNKSIACRVT